MRTIILILSILAINMKLAASPVIASAFPSHEERVKFKYVKHTESAVEARWDKLMTNYTNKLKAAFAEKDDTKTIKMIYSIRDEFQKETQPLVPELKNWINSLSEPELMELQKRLEDKPYRAEMYEILFNDAVTNRIMANPELKQAIEDLHEGTKVLASE